MALIMDINKEKTEPRTSWKGTAERCAFSNASCMVAPNTSRDWSGCLRMSQANAQPESCKQVTQINMRYK